MTLDNYQTPDTTKDVSTDVDLETNVNNSKETAVIDDSTNSVQEATLPVSAKDQTLDDTDDFNDGKYSSTKAYELNSSELESDAVGVQFATPEKVESLIKNEAKDSKIASDIDSFMAPSSESSDPEQVLMPTDESSIKTVGDYIAYKASVIVPADNAWNSNKSVQQKYLEANGNDIAKAQEAFFIDYKKRVDEVLSAERKNRTKLAVDKKFAILAGLEDDEDISIRDNTPIIKYAPKTLGGQAQVGYDFEGDQTVSTRWAEIRNNIGFIDDKGDLVKLNNGDTFWGVIGNDKYTSSDGRKLIGFANTGAGKDYRGIPLLKAVYDGDTKSGPLISVWDYNSFLRSNRLSRHWYTAVATGAFRTVVNTLDDLVAGSTVLFGSALEFATGKDYLSDPIKIMKSWHTSSTDEEMKSMFAPSGIIDFAWSMAGQMLLAFFTGGLSIYAGTALKSIAFAGSKAVLGDVMEGVLEASAKEAVTLTAAEQMLWGKIGTGIVYGPMMGYEARREALDRGFSVREADTLSIASMIAAGAIFANSSLMPFSREGKWLAKANRMNLEEVFGKLDPAEKLTREQALKSAAEVAEKSLENSNEISLLSKFSSKFKGKFPKLMSKLIKADERLGEKIASNPGSLKKLYWEALAGSGSMGAVSMVNAALKTLWSMPAMLEYRDSIDEKSIPYFWTPEDDEFWKEWGPQFMQTVVMGAAGGMLGNVLTSAFGTGNEPSIFTGHNSEDLLKLAFKAAQGDAKSVQGLNEVLLTIDKAGKKGYWASKKLSIEFGEDGKPLSVQESKHKVSRAEAYSKIIKQQIGAFISHASGFDGTYTEFIDANPELKVQLNNNDMLWNRYKVAYAAQKEALGNNVTPEIWQSYINGGNTEFIAYTQAKREETKESKDNKEEKTAADKVTKANGDDPNKQPKKPSEEKPEEIKNAEETTDKENSDQEHETENDAVEILTNRTEKYSKAQIRDYERKLSDKKEAAAVEFSNKFKISLQAARQFVDASDKLDDIFHGREIGDMLVTYHILNSPLFGMFDQFAEDNLRLAFSDIPTFFRKLLASDEKAMNDLKATSGKNKKFVEDLIKKVNSAKTIEELYAILMQPENLTTLDDGSKRIKVDVASKAIIEKKFNDLYIAETNDKLGAIKSILLNKYVPKNVLLDSLHMNDSEENKAKFVDELIKESKLYRDYNKSKHSEAEEKQFNDSISKLRDKLFNALYNTEDITKTSSDIDTLYKQNNISKENTNSILRRINKVIDTLAGISGEGEIINDEFVYKLKDHIGDKAADEIGKLLIIRENLRKLQRTTDILKLRSRVLHSVSNSNVSKAANKLRSDIEHSVSFMDSGLYNATEGASNLYASSLAEALKIEGIDGITANRDYILKVKLLGNLITDVENDTVGMLLHDFDVDSNGNVTTKSRLLFNDIPPGLAEAITSGLNEVSGISVDSVMSALKFLKFRMDGEDNTAVNYLLSQIRVSHGVKIFDNVDELKSLIAKIALRSAMVDAYSNTDLLAKLGIINNYNTKIFNDIDFYSSINTHDVLAFSKTLNKYIIDPSVFLELTQKQSNGLLAEGSVAFKAYEEAHKRIAIMRGITHSGDYTINTLYSLYEESKVSAKPEERLKRIKQDAIEALDSIKNIVYSSDNPEGNAYIEKFLADTNIPEKIEKLANQIDKMQGDGSYSVEDMKTLGDLFTDVASSLYGLDDNVKRNMLHELPTGVNNALLIAMLVGDRTKFVGEMSKYSEDSGITPTLAQDIGAFIVYSVITSKFSEIYDSIKLYKNAVRILGVQGAGKTKVVLPLAIRAAGIDGKEIIASAYATEQAQILEEALKSQGVVPDVTESVFDLYKALTSPADGESSSDAIKRVLSGKNIITIDEATLMSAGPDKDGNPGDFDKLLKIVNEENSRRKDSGEKLLTVVVIGDPKQGGYIEGMPTLESGMSEIDPQELSGASNRNIGRALNSSIISIPSLTSEFRYNVADIHKVAGNITEISSELSPINSKLTGNEDLPTLSTQFGMQTDGVTLGGVRFRTVSNDTWNDTKLAESIEKKTNGEGDNPDTFKVAILGYTSLDDIPNGVVKDALRKLIESNEDAVIFRTLSTIQGSESTYVLGKMPEGFLNIAGKKSGNKSARWKFFSMVVGRATDYIDLGVGNIPWKETEVETIYRIGEVNRSQVNEMWKEYFDAWATPDSTPTVGATPQPKKEGEGVPTDSQKKPHSTITTNSSNTKNTADTKKINELVIKAKDILSNITEKLSDQKVVSILNSISTQPDSGMSVGDNIKQRVNEISKELNTNLSVEKATELFEELRRISTSLYKQIFVADTEDADDMGLKMLNLSTVGKGFDDLLSKKNIAAAYTEQIKEFGYDTSFDSAEQLLAYYTNTIYGNDVKEYSDFIRERIAKIHSAINRGDTKELSSYDYKLVVYSNITRNSIVKTLGIVAESADDVANPVLIATFPLKDTKILDTIFGKKSTLLKSLDNAILKLNEYHKNYDPSKGEFNPESIEFGDNIIYTRNKLAKLPRWFKPADGSMNTNHIGVVRVEIDLGNDINSILISRGIGKPIQLSGGVIDPIATIGDTTYYKIGRAVIKRVTDNSYAPVMVDDYGNIKFGRITKLPRGNRFSNSKVDDVSKEEAIKLFKENDLDVKFESKDELNKFASKFLGGSTYLGDFKAKLKEKFKNSGGIAFSSVITLTKGKDAGRSFILYRIGSDRYDVFENRAKLRELLNKFERTNTDNIDVLQESIVNYYKNTRDHVGMLMLDNPQVDLKFLMDILDSDGGVKDYIFTNLINKIAVSSNSTARTKLSNMIIALFAKGSKFDVDESSPNYSTVSSIRNDVDLAVADNKEVQYLLGKMAEIANRTNGIISDDIFDAHRTALILENGGGKQVRFDSFLNLMHEALKELYTSPDSEEYSAAIDGMNKILRITLGSEEGIYVSNSLDPIEHQTDAFSITESENGTVLGKDMIVHAETIASPMLFIQLNKAVEAVRNFENASPTTDDAVPDIIDKTPTPVKSKPNLKEFIETLPVDDAVKQLLHSIADDSKKEDFINSAIYKLFVERSPEDIRFALNDSVLTHIKNNPEIFSSVSIPLRLVRGIVNTFDTFYTYMNNSLAHINTLSDFKSKLNELELFNDLKINDTPVSMELVHDKTSLGNYKIKITSGDNNIELNSTIMFKTLGIESDKGGKYNINDEVKSNIDSLINIHNEAENAEDFYFKYMEVVDDQLSKYGNINISTQDDLSSTISNIAEDIAVNYLKLFNQDKAKDIMDMMRAKLEFSSKLKQC